jgi:hypothetical protein
MPTYILLPFVTTDCESKLVSYSKLDRVEYRIATEFKFYRYICRLRLLSSLNYGFAVGRSLTQ